MIYYNGKESTPKLNGVDLSKVMHNGKQVWPKIVTEIALADTKAGDVLLWDKINQKKLFTSSDNLSSYPAESYTPIGVVVVPASHNVYGDGSCGVMSLKEMNYNSPSTGSTSGQNMLWGVYDDNISGLPDLDQVPTGNTSNGIPTGSISRGRLPGDRFSDIQCAHDTDVYYDASSNCIPSPYLTDGSRNPGYYQTTSPSSLSNALADFDGIGNTEKIIAQRGTKDYNSWTPSNSEADYPTASCCDMFYTEGTSQGDWYLPAMGELGYILPPFNKINQAITNTRAAYGSSVGVRLWDSTYYWSSTEYRRGSARYVYTGGNYIDYGSKNGANHSRAFLKVSPLDLS